MLSFVERAVNKCFLYLERCLTCYERLKLAVFTTGFTDKLRMKNKLQPLRFLNYNKPNAVVNFFSFCICPCFVNENAHGISILGHLQWTKRASPLLYYFLRKTKDV